MSGFGVLGSFVDVYRNHRYSWFGGARVLVIRYFYTEPCQYLFQTTSIFMFCVLANLLRFVMLSMKCLVEEGNAIAFLGPLMRAAERGCMQVVQWFVKRGCRDMELCLALTAATSSSQVEVAAYLLPFVPPPVLTALSIEILKAAGERSGGSLQGVEFILKSDFLGDPMATYSVADSIARSSEDESVPSDLKSFLREHWSESAFEKGMRESHENFMNFMRVLKRGE